MPGQDITVANKKVGDEIVSIDKKVNIFIGVGSVLMSIIHVFFVKNIGLAVIFLLLGIIFIISEIKK